MIDGLLDVLFGAGCVAPFFTPTIRAAATKADKPDDFCFLRKANQMRRHRSAGGMSESQDLPAAEVLIGQQSRPLDNGVERALQVAIFDFFGRQFAVQEINWSALRDGLLPNASGRIVTRIGKSQSFEALGSENSGQTRSAVWGQVHDLFAARSAVKTNEGKTGINFFLGSIERTMHIPIIAVSVVARRDLFQLKVYVLKRCFHRQPLIPCKFQ